MKKLKTAKEIKAAKQALKVKTLLVSSLLEVIGGGACSCYTHAGW